MCFGGGGVVVLVACWTEVEFLCIRVLGGGGLLSPAEPLDGERQSENDLSLYSAGPQLDGLRQSTGHTTGSPQPRSPTSFQQTPGFFTPKRVPHSSGPLYGRSRPAALAAAGCAGARATASTGAWPWAWAACTTWGGWGACGAARWGWEGP